MGGSSKKSIVGYKYHMSQQQMLCRGEWDAVTRLQVDDEVVWKGRQKSGSIYIDAPECFGGEKKEGGIKGTVDLCSGELSQGKNNHLMELLGSLIPAFRRVGSVVLRQVYLGTNPYLKHWTWETVHITKDSDCNPMWYVEKAEVGTDSMNGVHIIYDLLTTNINPKKVAKSLIDDDNFRACADTVYAEGIGISIKFQSSANIEDFVGEILKHIDGVLRTDPATGKIQIKLLREDYDTDDLPVFSLESGIKSIETFKRQDISQVASKITLKYTDLENWTTATLSLTDDALRAQQGSATIDETITMTGITNETDAAKILARERKSMMVPLLAVELVCDTKADSLREGDPFILNLPDEGLHSVVMRLTGKKIGDMKKGQITILATQDVFGVEDAIYTPPPRQLYESPVNAPVAAEHRLWNEAPYYFVAQELGDAAAQAVDSTSAYLFSACESPTPDSYSYELQTLEAGKWVTQDTPVDFAPIGFTVFPVKQEVVSVIEFENTVDFDRIEVGDLMKIGDEFVEVNSISGFSLTVNRGMLDTVPVAHTAGTMCMVLSGYMGIDETERTINQTITAKMLPLTGKGQLDVDNAPSDAHQITGRMHKPYPPGNVTVNGEYFPDAVVGDSVAIAWAHRDRLQQTAGFIDYETGDIGPEEGVTYSLNIEGEAGQNLISDDVASTSYGYDDPDYVVCSSPLGLNTTVRAGEFEGGSALNELIPKMGLWLSTDDATTITESSGVVTNWADKSGNGRDISQPSISNAPVYDIADACIDFSGSDTYLYNDSPFMYSAGECYIFIVTEAETSSTVSSRAMITEGNTGSINPLYMPVRNPGSGGTDADGSIFIRSSNDTQLIPHGTYLYDEFFVGKSILSAFDTGSTFNQVKNSVEGTPLSYSRSYPLNGLDRFCVGGLLRASFVSHFPCKIYEIIILTTSPTDDERSKIEGDLAWRHGLVADLPNDHPYKLSPPNSSSGAIPTPIKYRQNDKLTIKLGAKIGSDESTQKHNVEIKRAGYGYRYGEYYGGLG